MFYLIQIENQLNGHNKKNNSFAILWLSLLLHQDILELLEVKMNEEYIELGRRAVACKGWRWMSGMRYRLHSSHPWFRYHGDDCADDDGNPIQQAPPNLQSKAALPDLTDPATLGCLLMLVREARKEPTYLPTCLDTQDEAWVIHPPGPLRQTRYSSMASALVATLEEK